MTLERKIDFTKVAYFASKKYVEQTRFEVGTEIIESKNGDPRTEYVIIPRLTFKE